MTKQDLNIKYAVATLNSKTFQYEITLETTDKQKATNANANDHTIIMREFEDLGLLISEQLQAQNNKLLDIAMKCGAINLARKTAKNAHTLITKWYVDNKDKIQFKDDGSLYKKWAESLKSELSKLPSANNLIVSYSWRYSLGVEVKVNFQSLNDVTHYFTEYAYICNGDGTLRGLDNQSDFKTVSPLRYFNALNELSEIDSKIDVLKSKKQALKNLISE